MHVIATAGHVDHGKSRLVQALTGIDPDRLEEEKRRGLTIDLGFAWLRFPSGREVGIVDVPGHERFIKNMLAGVGAINVTLFVVAANEGWKPQSQEHLDILDLLAVSAAVVAVTKADTVGSGELDRLIEEVSRRISSTTIAGAPIIPVSAVTGEGLEKLVAEMEHLLDRTPPAEDRGRPRLWIDRIFTMRGSGTVVTGTLTGGGLEQNQEIEILPEGLRARIRSIQSHRKKVERISPGNRTALNLVGVEPESLRRGDVATLPGMWRPTRRALATIRFLPHLSHEPTERGAFKFYVGAGESDAEIRFLEGEPEPGETTFAHIALVEPVVLDWRDRFVLRDAGRRETAGGGEVLEPHASHIGRRDPALVMGARRRMEATDRAEYLTILIDEEGALPRREITLRAGLRPQELGDGAGIWLETAVFSKLRFAELEGSVVEALEDHQESHPLEPGMPREAVRTAVGLDSRTFDDLLDELSRRQVVVAEGTFLRTPEHAPLPTGPARDALIREVEGGGSSPPTIPELEERHDPALIRALVRTGELTQISPEIVYPAARLEEIKRGVAEHIESSGPLTVAAFRDLFGTTRKYAVPLLEYLDQAGFTRRQGDVRILGPKAGS